MDNTSGMELQGQNEAHEIHERHIRGLSKKAVSSELHTSLPGSFYHSKEVYELERRAIFSYRWFLVSHKARYRNVGDYVQYEMAGYNFVVVKNKSGQIVGFHNICRHRAFPVVQETCGNARVFSCKYHGWTYDLSGKLTKAPRFTSDTFSSFDAQAIRLFPIHMHTDRNGFVYVNLDASKTPMVSWEAQYGDLDNQEVLRSSNIDWDAVTYDFTWTKEGSFNWKLMQDNYNECYHCLTAHPDVASTTVTETYYVIPSETHNYIAHFSEPKPSILYSSQFDATRFKGRSATHVFPVGHFSPNPGTGFMHLMRSIPISGTKTRQEYDVYKLNTPSASAEKHERMIRFYQKVVDEDFALCEGVHRNLERGIWNRGPLHPFHEEGVRAFQGYVLRALKDQIRREKEVGREIWAARPVSDTDTGIAQDEAVDEILSHCEKASGCQVPNGVEFQW